MKRMTEISKANNFDKKTPKKFMFMLRKSNKH